MPETKSPDALLPGEIRVIVQLSVSGTIELTAAALFISENTVSTHLRNARKRNHVNSNIQLLRIAVEQGLHIIKLKAPPAQA